MPKYLINDFFMLQQAVAGRKADQIWMVMDELMETVKVLQPKLYQAVIDKINGD